MMTRQIRVSGRVQGVGFRDALRDEAERAGLTGWVRNRADGTVEAVLQGEADGVQTVVRWARRGPALASVQELIVAAPEPAFDRSYERFERWPTV
jgi:acylphosphatase